MKCQHPNCEKNGDYPLIIKRGEEKRRMFLCLDHQQEAKKRRRQDEDKNVEDRIEDLFGEKFRDATFSTFRTDPEYFQRLARKIQSVKGEGAAEVTPEDISNIQEAKSSLRSFTEEMADTGEGTVFLFGPNGLGKTHLLASATRELIRSGRSAASWHMTRLATKIWDTYSSSAATEVGTVEKIIESMKAVDVLILQDINDMCFADDIRQYIFEIIDDVYRNRGILMMSANLSPEQLMEEDRLGTPPVTRLLEPPSCIKRLSGPSHRQARKAYEKQNS